MDISEDKYIEIIEKMNELTKEPKAYKNSMLKQIFWAKLNNFSRTCIKTDSTEEMKTIEYLFEELEKTKKTLVQKDSEIKDSIERET